MSATPDAATPDAATLDAATPDAATPDAATPLPGPRTSRTGRRPRLGTRHSLIVFGSVLLLGASAGSYIALRGARATVDGAFVAAATAAGMACLLVACLPIACPARLGRARGDAQVAAMVLGLALAVIGALTTVYAYRDLAIAPPARGYITDTVAFDDADARLVLTGRNPYTSDAAFWRVIERDPYALATPLRRGAFASATRNPSAPRILRTERAARVGDPSAQAAFDPRTLHSYPALAFLVYVPLVALGASNILPLQVMVCLALLLWLVWRAPRGARLSAAVAAGAALAIPLYSLYRETEVLCLALLLPAWALRRWRGGWLAAVLLGLACAFKQYSWFFAPFFVLDALLSRGWRAALRQGLLALAAFLVPNLPFLLASPSAWWASLWLPMRDPLFAGGIGLVALGIGGLMPLLPAAAYAALEALALAGVLVAYAHWHARLGECALLLALLPMCLAYRALPDYVGFAPWLALAAVSSWQRARVAGAITGTGAITGAGAAGA